MFASRISSTRSTLTLEFGLVRNASRIRVLPLAASTSCLLQRPSTPVRLIVRVRTTTTGVLIYASCVHVPNHIPNDRTFPLFPVTLSRGDNPSGPTQARRMPRGPCQHWMVVWYLVHQSMLKSTTCRTECNESHQLWRDLIAHHRMWYNDSVLRAPEAQQWRAALCGVAQVHGDNGYTMLLFLSRQPVMHTARRSLPVTHHSHHAR